MKQRVLDNEELEKLVICPKCNTLHRKIPLEPGKRAVCKNCKMVLYRYDPKYLDRALALAITGLIFFVMANTFPLVRIDFIGNEQHVNVIDAISELIESGFYVVAMGVMFLVLIIPAMVIVDYIVLIILLKTGKGKKVTRDLLVLLSKLIPWSMVDIFSVSILIALVKLAGKVQIHFGVSFWALLFYVAIDMYLTKARKIGLLWELRNRIFNGR